MSDVQPDDILHYWFGELEDGWTTSDRNKLWFGALPADDQDMREKFGDTVARALDGELEEWRQTDSGLTAYLLLLDQMTRAIYRGTAKAFAGDPRALAACKAGLDDDADKRIPAAHCRFFYLPLEHSENLADQQRCVELFAEAARRFDSRKKEFAESKKYAEAHLDIIRLFGRFPHRNKILSRQSTPEEEQYLQQNPGAHFNQQNEER